MEKSGGDANKPQACSKDHTDSKPVIYTEPESLVADSVIESIPIQESEPPTPVDELDTGMSSMHVHDQCDSYTYDMTFKSRGYFIIINNKTFKPETKMNVRTGTDVDAANLYATFKGLDFNVKIYNDLKAEKMLKLMIEVSRYDHSQCDCLGVAILSHGDEGIVYGIDQIVKIDTLVAPFKGNKCPSLVGKPKFFVIQACRGTELDHGVQHDAQAEEQEQVYRIPTEADILYAYSTVSGYFSWRNSSKGSWFIQALCRQLEKYGSSWDIMRILTRVSHEVAYEFESNASQSFMNKKKQVPSIVSMLTKELVFHRKG